MRAAAAVIIGNEVLTAKVADTNGPYLVRALRSRGVPVLAVHVVLDEVDAIVEAVSLARRRAEWVFTSGGIGPTHDDVTVRAVAMALGRDVVRMPEMEALIRAFWQGRATAMPTEALRLAEAPRGSRLIHGERLRLPVLATENVFMLPGVPELFEVQLDTVLSTLPKQSVTLKVLYLSQGESEIAHVLDRIAIALPHVAIGSYPTFDQTLAWKVRVTVEHAEPGPVEAAVTRLKAELPPGAVVRIEDAKE